MSLPLIPEITKKAPKARKIHGELSPELYLQIESEAFQRGTTPYQLVSAVVKAFLTGGLVQVSEPESDAPSDAETASEPAAPSPSPSVTGA